MFWSRKPKQLRGFRKKDIKIINKPVYENPYFKKRKLGIILRHLRNPKKIILILIIIGVVYFLFYSKYFKIEIVDIQGNQELTYDRVRYEVNKAFVVRRFIIFRQSNIFIYNIDQQKEVLWDVFALDEIKIKKRFPNKVIVTLKEKIPNLTFISNDKYYYLDLNGTLITPEIPIEEIKEHFPIVEDLNGREVKIKDEIIPEKIVTAIFDLKEEFPTKANTNINRFYIPKINCPTKNEVEEVKLENNNTNQSKENNNTNDSPVSNKNINGNTNTTIIKEEKCDLAPITHDLSVKSEEGWEAYFSTANEDIFTQLERLKTYLLKKALDKESRGNIVYIDLRFGDKIYVKEK